MNGDPNTQTLTNTLAERIRDDLFRQNLAENELFMTESQLAEHYAVSRNVAREAVSQLRALGILKSRQRKGLLVGRSDPVDLLSQSLPFFARSADEMIHLAQLRFVLECAAPLAVANATEEQVHRLIGIAHAYRHVAAGERAAGVDFAESDRLELAFHSLILEMTCNPLVAGMYRVTAEFFDRAPCGLSGWAVSEPRTSDEHVAIAEAFRQRDHAAAQNLLAHHLRGLRDPHPIEPTKVVRNGR